MRLAMVLVFILQQMSAFAEQTIDASSGFLEVEGGRIYYEVRGKGKPLVFVHDGMMHSASWENQWNEFAKEYQVIRYDRRGFGKSPAANARYSEIKDLHTLLRKLDISRATMIGCSAGGRLVLDFALEHQEMVDRMVLVGAVVSGFDFTAHFEERVAVGFEPLREQGDVPGSVANWLKDPWLIHSTNQEAKKRFSELLLANPQNFRRPGHLEIPPARPASKNLGEIKVPVLLVLGESDMPDVHAHGGVIASGIEHSIRVIVPGAGHFVHLEKPREFNDLVKNFLLGSGFKHDLVLKLPEMEQGVIIQSNVVFKTDALGELKMDIYSPPGESSGSLRPAIIYVAGDADPETLKNAKDWRFLQSYGKLAASRGCAGITFNHRSSEGGPKLGLVRSDIDDLISYIRNRAADFKIDTNRLCLWFFSGSGVHLESGMGKNAAGVRCIVAYYPALAPQPGAPLLSAELTKFNAINQLERNFPNVPPLFLAKAGKDWPGLNADIEAFRQRAKALGVSLNFVEHADGFHAFDILNNDRRSREIISSTLEFIGKHL